jgi:hypothetical protein
MLKYFEHRAVFPQNLRLKLFQSIFSGNPDKMFKEQGCQTQPLKFIDNRKCYFCQAFLPWHIVFHITPTADDPFIAIIFDNDNESHMVNVVNLGVILQLPVTNFIFNAEKPQLP